MSDPDGRKRNFIFHMFKWLGVYFGISIALSIFIPFPWSIIAFIGIYMLIQFARRYIGSSKGKTGGSFFQPSSMSGYNPIKYYCMSCGQQHNERACPRCGSKMKKMG